MSSLNELIQKSLYGSIGYVPLFLYESTFSLLIAFFGISSHESRFSIVRLVLNSSEEFVNWFLKNHIDAQPHSISIVSHILFSFLK